MALNVRGTEIWFYDSEESKVVKVGCPTSLSGIDGARDQVEVPACLDAEDKEFLAGQITPGTAAIDINYDPKTVSHTRMHELYREGKVLPFVVGMAGSKTAPTWGLSDDDWDLPTDRSFLKFTGYFANYSFEFPSGGTVSSAIPVQMSTTAIPVPATT